MILIGLGVWLWFANGSSDPKPATSSGSAASSLPASRKVDPSSKNARSGVVSDKAAATGKLHADWKRVSDSGITGAALLDARREIAARAIEELGPGPELEKFLAFLKEQGQGDLVGWMIREGVADFFKGEMKEQGLQWFAGLADEKIQEKMGYLAGRNMDAKEIEPWIKRFTDIHVQSSVLTGYCSEYAKNDPSMAVREFLRMKPGSVDMTGLGMVMGAAPAGSDFVGLSGMVPDDGKSLAKNARKALLGAWAKSEPQKAGEFVLANTSTVHADQMGVVIGGWATKDVSSALDWVEALPEGDHRDYGMAALAQARVKDDPAWSRAAIDAIQNAKIRESATKDLNKPR